MRRVFNPVTRGQQQNANRNNLRPCKDGVGVASRALYHLLRYDSWRVESKSIRKSGTISSATGKRRRELGDTGGRRRETTPELHPTFESEGQKHPPCNLSCPSTPVDFVPRTRKAASPKRVRSADAKKERSRERTKKSRTASTSSSRSSSAARSASGARGGAGDAGSGSKTINATSSSSSRRKRTPTPPRPCKIHVGRLTRNVTRDHLLEIFGCYGAVKSVELPPDRTHSHLSRGFAYIEFENPADAERAMRHMDGGQIDGQEVTAASVLLPRPVPPRRPSPPMPPRRPPAPPPHWRRSPPPRSRPRRSLSLFTCHLHQGDVQAEVPHRADIARQDHPADHGPQPAPAEDPDVTHARAPALHVDDRCTHWKP
ncbi:hypothetical protein HPB50_017947 [Hyalomma asiaticum]|uniref:Uncharacterized protein n=1 Tax=Hyalomma asiaticum TaxID=266040 RepID=A0ACB7TAR7_HYAAI|nr:hypothetical protein HPB50_017947 [Hyalomma asiaticum]